MRIRHDGRIWDVFLGDDGTLDTVVTIQPVARPKKTYSDVDGREYPTDSRGPYYPSQEVRFDSEHAASFRRADGSMTIHGLRELSREAIESYDQD